MGLTLAHAINILKQNLDCFETSVTNFWTNSFQTPFELSQSMCATISNLYIEIAL